MQKRKPNQPVNLDSQIYGSYDAVELIVGSPVPRHPKNLQRWLDKGFPPAVMLGSKTKVWRLSAVKQYMAKLEAEANAPKRIGGRHA